VLPLANAQTGNCKVLFKKAFEEFREPTGDAYALAYTMESTSRDDMVKLDKVLIKMKGSRTYMQTEANQVYKDAESTVFIDDVRKLIFITKVDSKNIDDAGIQSMLQMQDSLLNSNQGMTCNVTENELGGDKKIIAFDESNSVVKSMGLNKLKYHIDLKSGELKTVELLYPKSGQLKSVVVSFDHYDKEFAGEVFNGPALAKVFDSLGELHSPYTDYRVIDKLSHN